MKLKTLLSAFVMCACLLGTGCSDWERTTFQTLSASKAIIDSAATDYEARILPHTSCVKDLIEKARAVDSDAVRAMGVYEIVKHSGGASDAATQAVEQALIDLAPVVATIQTLSTRPCAAHATLIPPHSWVTTAPWTETVISANELNPTTNDAVFRARK